MSATIASIHTEPIYVDRTYGVYEIPKAADDGTPGVLVVDDKVEVYDIGNAKKSKEYWKAEDIAKDLVVGWEPLGVWVCKGESPTNAEQVQALKGLTEMYKRKVREADKLWENPHKRSDISDFHRKAAKALGLERDWLYDLKITAECPACGERIKPGVAKCKTCGAILDKKLAAKFGLVAVAE